ncbi:TPA: class I SAM-dependent methyltransferase [Candidatus Woesearchaeota archaeon]|nr:class I SAM-dependent methyltransferase [Candidatus Woesearchaeota archaeon]
MAEHYYSKEQTSKFEPKKIKARLLGNELELYTAGGVFSPTHIDRGSLLLIDEAHIDDGWKILDMGCGYGAVGIAQMKEHPGVRAVFSDVNERAVKLTKMNLKLNRLDGEVVQGDSFERVADKDFDTILLNPPQTAGKKVCFRMIEEAKEHLRPGGTLQMVARHNKGGKELEKKMQEVFGNTEQTAKSSGFRIYVSVRQKDKAGNRKKAEDQ